MPATDTYMDLYALSQQLNDILQGSKAVYLRTEPEVLDFTTATDGSIVIGTKRGSVTFDLKDQDLWGILAILRGTVFDPEQVPTLLCWNLKSLLSFLRARLSTPFVPENSVIDIQVIENFLNITKKRPENVVDALNRSKALFHHEQCKSWKRLYHSLHLPLLTRVLPALESNPLLDKEDGQVHHAFYEIEGQQNGRINCYKKFKKSFLPTTMSVEQRGGLRPRGYGLGFLASDFRGCEVAVLQWLTKDTKLGEVISRGSDVHTSLYEEICEGPCDTDKKRSIFKRCFLPVMYGCSAAGLTKNVGIASKYSEAIVSRIRIKFTTAWEWMQEQQKVAEHRGRVEDHFGRIRQFKDGEAYLARNFAVQGVAATFCQEKLVALHDALQNEEASLCYFIHDGYGLTFRLKQAKHYYDLVKETLESPSQLCPGLSVKVEVKFGKRLDQMKVFWRDCD